MEEMNELRTRKEFIVPDTANQKNSNTNGGANVILTI